MPWSFRITIADNASTDQTALIARRLSHAHPEVAVVHLAGEGSRPRAQAGVERLGERRARLHGRRPVHRPGGAAPAGRAAGQRALRPRDRLPARARLPGPSAAPKRELISRSYNLLLRQALRARFSDAQCGFKAIRRHAARELLPLVEDDAWFFDTELLVVAERAGLRIHEVPVDWIDDPDSSVDIVRTAIDDLLGVARLGRSLVRGTLPLREIGVRLGRTSAEAGRGRLGMQVGHLPGDRGLLDASPTPLLYLGLRPTMSPGWANFTALLVTAVAEHRGQPAVHLRRARSARRRTPPGAGARDLRGRAGSDLGFAGAVARRGVPEPLPRRSSY